MDGVGMNIHFHGEHANSFTKFTQLFNAKRILDKKNTEREIRMNKENGTQKTRIEIRLHSTR